MAKVIYDGKYVQVLVDDRGGDCLLITFNEMDIFADGVHYWGDALASKLSMSCIGFMTKTKNWFPKEDMIEACGIAWQHAHQFPTRIAYGFSQGGYASVKYSGLLQATHVLAFSPQWTTDPSRLNDPRFGKFYSKSLHAEMEIARADVAGKIFLFADPFYRIDWSHCRVISEQIDGGSLVPIRHIGHGSVRAVASTEIFKELTRITTSDHCENSRELLKLMLRGKKRTFLYQSVLGLAAAKKGHLKWAQNLCDWISSLKPDHPIVDVLARTIQRKLAQMNVS